MRRRPSASARRAVSRGSIVRRSGIASAARAADSRRRVHADATSRGTIVHGARARVAGGGHDSSRSSPRGARRRTRCSSSRAAELRIASGCCWVRSSWSRKPQSHRGLEQGEDAQLKLRALWQPSSFHVEDVEHACGGANAHDLARLAAAVRRAGTSARGRHHLRRVRGRTGPATCFRALASSAGASCRQRWALSMPSRSSTAQASPRLPRSAYPGHPRGQASGQAPRLCDGSNLGQGQSHGCALRRRDVVDRMGRRAVPSVGARRAQSALHTRRFHCGSRPRRSPHCEPQRACVHLRDQDSTALAEQRTALAIASETHRAARRPGAA